MLQELFQGNYQNMKKERFLVSKLVAYKLSYIKIKKLNQVSTNKLHWYFKGKTAISPGALPTGKGLEQVFDL